MSRQLTLCAPSRLEAARLSRGTGGAAVERIGVGAAAARRAGLRLGLAPDRPVAVAGVCGGIREDLRPGDVVVATQVQGPDGTVDCPSAPLLLGALRRAGLSVHAGPIASADHIVTGAERGTYARRGVLAVDMESAWLLAGRTAAGSPWPTGEPPRAVIRVVGDVATHPLMRPRTLSRLRTALAVLPRVAPALTAWGDATGSRRVLLASPRSFCAGVVRAIEVVERALEQRGGPVHVRKQIVHNRHVVGDLQSRGAVFVDELDEVPDGGTVVFSAHGVAPAVRSEAARRGLHVIDATCPLVAKVHAEVRRFAESGDTVLFIGHAGHEETVGTLGERPGQTLLVEDEAQAARVEVADPERVAYLVQTTLAADEVDGIVAVLRQRFPRLRRPPSEDICYATTNRQRALASVVGQADLALVIGSANSSNSSRLVELARRLGTPARLVDDVEDVDLDWLAGVGTLAVTAGASAPESLVDELVAALRGLGPTEVIHHELTTEDIRFTVPKEVRPA